MIEINAMIGLKKMFYQIFSWMEWESESEKLRMIHQR